MTVHYRIQVTTNDGVFWYSATRGLVDHMNEWHLATRFESRDAVEVAVRLLQRRKGWFVQWKREEIG